MTTTTLDVKGMTCNHCVMAVKGALQSLENIAKVDVDLQSGKVQIEHEGDSTRIPEFKKAVEEQGYDVI